MLRFDAGGARSVRACDDLSASFSAYVSLRNILRRRSPVSPRGYAASKWAFLAIVGGLLFLLMQLDGRINRPYMALHFLIIAVSLAHILWVRRFNLGASYSLFTLFFFGIIPLFEYRLGVTYNAAPFPRDSSYAAGASLVLLSSACFYLGYGLIRGVPFDPHSLAKVRFMTPRHRQLALWCTFAALGAFALLIAAYYEFSLPSILFRGFAEEKDQSAFGISFVTYVARPLFLNLTLVMLAASLTRRPVPYVRMFALFCGALLFVSPIGIPRSLAGALYIPLLMMVFVPRYYSKYSLICVILFAVLFAAPLADVFRGLNSKNTNVDLGQNYNLFYVFSGHFDAFHNFVQVIDLDYESEGWQVIGILLFWVPRAIWEGKPQGTSQDFANFAGYEAHNVSFPLPAEFYVDYGVGGVALGMFIVGVIYRRADTFLSQRKERGSLQSYIFAIAHLELSILGLYLLRGSVLSSFAYTVGVASTLGLMSISERCIRGLCAPNGR
jgi:oligosaccharide repeat unit polymerase